MAQPGRGQDGTAGPEATPDPAGPGLTRALLGPAALLGLGGLLLLHGPAWAALAVAALLPAGLAGCWPACRRAAPAAPPARRWRRRWRPIRSSPRCCASSSTPPCAAART
ncbi:hypothetical protein ACFFMP_07515 [Pseudoroseomonas cervicalis]|uniref:hypothetical protein n=1 Tax=Teichococcus cervicalis TaxID=204525 RepID=UPI0035EFEF7A